MHIPFKASNPRIAQVTTLMAKSGMNLRDLPQLLNPNYAQDITNFFITTDGGLIRRRGKSTLFTQTGTNGITMDEKFTDDLDIYGYGTKLEAYSHSAGTKTVIKTFTTTGTFSGKRWGDYFFVTNGTEAIGRVSRTLAYDTQTVNYTVGDVLTGATSGATSIILQDADSGATGTLTLGSIVGTYQVGETITSTSGGSAKVTSVLAWAYTSISGAPIATVLMTFASRLYAGVKDTVYYSNKDAGTNPPFATWTAGTLATDPGLVQNKNAGTIRALQSLGQNVVVFADDGKWGFYTTTITDATTLRKVDTTVIDRTDFGGSRAALSTPKGTFYANEAGLWQLMSLGQDNVKFSDQEGLTSILLGTTYFDDVTLTNADIAYYAKYNTILLTCAKASAGNNLIIAYNLENKSFSKFTGWEINRFLNDNGTIYGTSTNTNVVYTLFDGWDDNGVDVWYNYKQELKTGDLESKQILLGGYIQGLLSPSSAPTVAFDIYDINGVEISNKLTFTWSAQSDSGTADGYGTSEWGESAWGGDEDTANTVESFDGFRDYIRNYQRIILHISGHDQIPLAINYVKILTRIKSSIRRRKLIKTS